MKIYNKSYDDHFKGVFVNEGECGVSAQKCIRLLAMENALRRSVYDSVGYPERNEDAVLDAIDRLFFTIPGRQPL